MEVFYEGKEELKDKKMGFKVHRHNFMAELEDGECFPFHVEEPDPFHIYLDEPIATAKGHALFGLAVMNSQEWIKDLIKEEMEKNAKDAIAK
jgi:hypothetical protein